MTDMSQPVYMNISFPNIPLAEAEGIRQVILAQISPGTSFSIHFDKPITSEDDEVSDDIDAAIASRQWPSNVALGINLEGTTL
jgi:hypothetical protein